MIFGISIREFGLEMMTARADDDQQARGGRGEVGKGRRRKKNKNRLSLSHRTLLCFAQKLGCLNDA